MRLSPKGWLTLCRDENLIANSASRLERRHPVLLTGWNLFHRAVPMSEKPAHKTKNKLAKIYVIGIVVFSAAFGFMTLFSIFLAHLKI